MKKQFYFFSLLFIPVFSFAQSSKAEMELMIKMLSLKNALIQKDSASLNVLLSDDVTYGHTNGLVQTKTELIRSVVSKEQDYKSIEPSDIKIRVYGSTAIVNMKSKVNLIYQGNSLDLLMNIVLVWIMKNNDWRLVARQSTKL